MIFVCYIAIMNKKTMFNSNGRPISNYAKLARKGNHFLLSQVVVAYLHLFKRLYSICSWLVKKSRVVKTFPPSLVCFLVKFDIVRLAPRLQIPNKARNSIEDMLSAPNTVSY